MIFPAVLKPGDTVAIAALSSPVEIGIEQACKTAVESMGYNVVLGNCVSKSIRGYAAGTGAEKADDLMGMFRDKSIKAIWCLRGGISSSHVVDKLDYAEIKRNPKIFVGYSNITTLHVMLNQKSSLVTFHGPMVRTNMLEKYDDFTRSNFELALNFCDGFSLSNPPGEKIMVASEGRAEGVIVGGNLALLTSMLGTPYQVEIRGKILFIEDVNEKLNKVDRMLHHLRYAGKFEGLKGLIVGDFSNCELDDPRYGLAELLADEVGTLGIPVLYNIKSGHCFPMSTIPLGAWCEMDTSTKSIKFTR